MTSTRMSSARRTSVLFPQQANDDRKDKQDEARAIPPRSPEFLAPLINPIEVRADRRLCNAEFLCDVFALHSSKGEFGGCRETGREFQFLDHTRPNCRIERQWRQHIGTPSRIFACHGGDPQRKKERRTKDARGTSARRHAERASADAPSRGAETKALLLY